MSDIYASMQTAASGLYAQSQRLKVIAQNIANSQTLPTAPGGEPYRRQTITFKNVMDQELGVQKVEVEKIGKDPSAFTKIFKPGHPAADEEGYVLKPNVNTFIEMQDQKEALRSYEANLTVIETSRSMLTRTLDLLR